MLVGTRETNRQKGCTERDARLLDWLLLLLGLLRELGSDELNLHWFACASKATCKRVCVLQTHWCGGGSVVPVFGYGLRWHMLRQEEQKRPTQSACCKIVATMMRVCVCVCVCVCLHVRERGCVFICCCGRHETWILCDTGACSGSCGARTTWHGCGRDNEVRTVERDTVVLLHGILCSLLLLVRDLCSAPGDTFFVVMHPSGPNLAELDEELL